MKKTSRKPTVSAHLDGGRKVPSTWRESFQLSEGGRGCVLRKKAVNLPWAVQAK